MEAQEIRLGNYIQYRDKSSLLTVESLGSNGFSTINQDGIQYGSDDISEYNGIPITQEWLLNLGFAKNKNTFILNKDSSVTHEKTGSESGFWYSNDESNAYCYRLKKIEFVHELQNLHFALTGEELQLK